MEKVVWDNFKVLVFGWGLVFLLDLVKFGKGIFKMDGDELYKSNGWF